MALVTPCFVFIHVPRTGGTSARTAILARFPDARDSDGSIRRTVAWDACGVAIPPEQHIAASKLEHRDARFRSMRFVGFVRQPVSWYVSMWSWAKKTNFAAKISTDPFAERHWLADVWNDELAGFIDNVIALRVPRAWVVFHEKLSRLSGGIPCFGRYENLEEDMIRLTGCTVASRQRQSDEKGTTEIDNARRCAIQWLERETIRKFYGDSA